MPENWVDIAILVVVAWNIADGVRRGFIFALIGLIGFVLSAVLALTLYVQLAEWSEAQWNLPGLLVRPLAFGALWAGASILVSVLGRFLGAPFSFLLRGSPLDLLLSILPSSAKGLIVSGFALTVLLAVPPLPEGAPGGVGFALLRQSIQQSALAAELVERTAAFDRQARELVGEPLSETLTLLTVRPETDERIDLDFRVASPAIDPAAEARMFELVNQERRRHGLRALVREGRIDEVARAHSLDMLGRGYFAHTTAEGRTPFQRLRDGGVPFTAAGENLALAPTVALAHQGLMESPGHRANILRGEFGRIGIGAVAADGRGYVFTQNFAD